MLNNLFPTINVFSKSFYNPSPYYTLVKQTMIEKFVLPPCIEAIGITSRALYYVKNTVLLYDK